MLKDQGPKRYEENLHSVPFGRCESYDVPTCLIGREVLESSTEGIKGMVDLIR